MGFINREFRLTNEPGGLGLSCTSKGLSLAGVPLLQKTEMGFAPRPAPEIRALIGAAYGADAKPDDLLPSLGLIARALDDEELSRAMIAAVLTRLPDLDWDAAARLAHAHQRLTKYDPNEPRDERGRWTVGDSVADAKPERTPVAFDPSQNDLDDDEPSAPIASSTFKEKYDGLGPTEFAKEVIQFGDRLGREGGHLSPAEREAALAEYNFLQDRLSFWLAYDYKPPDAQANLLSAAVTLYEGAINSGIVPVGGPHGDLPQSMAAVASSAFALDSSQAAPALRRPSTEPVSEDDRTILYEGPKEFEQQWEIAANDTIKIVWNGGIKDQGKPWEEYIEKENPDLTRQVPNSKTFDFFDQESGEAISAKTLNTLSVTYIQNPQTIYKQMKTYIDAAADYYSLRMNRDIDPEKIKSKTIQLAVPEYTSSIQWKYLDQAQRYANDRGISLLITRIRE